MQQSLKRILLDPAVSRLVAVLVGLVAIVRLLQRSAVGRIQDADTRYRARKVLACGGYVAAVAVILVVYSNRLTGLTVAFGVAGAGIAFALQEVIASVAGWVALSFSR